MVSFWTSGTGEMPTGLPQDAFVSDFSIIPEGTSASAMIKSFTIVEKENKYSGTTDKFYNVVYRLLDGNFKSREVTQKIKCFDGKPEQIQRALNMLKLVMQLCDFKPSHNNAPGDIELITMVNKVVSIKIGEWSMPKADGGIIEGNFVREVHASGAIVTETGVKAEVVHRPTDSALQRNATLPELDDGLPF